MEPTQVTLHEGQDSWFAEELIRALQKAGIVAQRTELEGGLFRVSVAQADVARGAAVLSALGDVGKPWSKEKVWLVGGGILLPAAMLAFLGQAVSPTPNTQALFGLGLLCWGAAHSFNKLTLPRTNTFGAWAWACAVVAVAVGNWSGSIAQLPPLARILVGVVLLGVALLGLGLTVAGVVAYLSAPGRYLRGAGDLTGAGIVLAIVAVSFVVGVLRVAGQGPSIGAPFDATPIVMADKNFRLTPVEPFRKLDFTKMLPEATVGFAAQGGRQDEVYAVLIAEVLPTEIATPALIDLQRQRLEARSKVVMEGPVPALVGGGAGQEASFRGVKMGNFELDYVMWVYSRNGFTYQWLAWGRTGTPVRERVLPLMKRFEIIDLERRAPGLEAQSSTSADSREYGYSVELPSPWSRPDKQTAEQFGGADFIATCSGQAWLTITPFPLGEHQVDDPVAFEALSRIFFDQNESPTRAPLKLEPPFRGERRVMREGDRTTTLDLVLSDGLAFVIHEERTTSAAGCAVALDLVKLSPVLRKDLAKAHKAGWLPAFYGELAHAAKEAEQPDLALAYLEDRFALAPTRVNGLELAQAAAQLKQTDAVLRALEKRAEGPTSLMHGAQALVLVEAGRKREAAAAFKKWFDAGFASDAWLLEYVWALEAVGQRKEALTRVAAYRKTHDGDTAVMVHAFLLQRAGQARAGLALLQAELERRLSAELLLGLMELHDDLEEREEALAAFAKWTDRGVSPTASILVEKGHVELGLNRVAAAKQSVDRALRLDPQDADAREFFETVKGYLGEGRNEALTEPIAAVPLPAELPGAAPLAQEAQQPAIYELRGTAIAFVPGKEQRETTYLNAKVNTREGVEMFSTLRFSIDPRREHLYLNSLVVKDAQGKLVGSGSVASMYFSDDASDERGTNQRTVYLPVPGLQAGFSLEAVVSRVLDEPSEELDFDVHHFSSSLPTRQSVLSLTGQLERVSFTERHLGEAKKRPQPGGVWWLMVDPPRLRSESFSPHIDEFLPTVTYGPVGDWAKLGSGYLAQVRKLTEPDGATTAQARAVVGQATSDEQRTLSLARWVHEHVTYKAIEFGRGARIPRPAPEVVSRGYGDCKDQSVLLLKLLRALGISAELALIRSAGPIDQKVPSLDQFDHMVVWLPGPRFVDPTADAPDAFHSAAYLAGQQALVLDARPHFEEVPAAELERALVVERTVRLEGKDAVVSEEVLAEGFMAVMLRREVLGSKPDEREQVLQSWIGARSKLSKVEELGTRTVSGPLKLKVEYRVANALRDTEGALIGELPAEWERSRLNVGNLGAPRLSPLRVRFPIKVESTTRIVPPRGFQLSPPKAGAGKSPFATWALTVSADAVVHFEYERLVVAQEADAYAAFVGAHEQMNESLRQPLMLKRVP